MKPPARRFRAFLFTLLLFEFLSGSAGAAVFPLPPEGEDVVGKTKEVRTRHEDTFSDIARKADLGYEEMVAANPGVDPWLPGEGTPVVLPTRFILPPGPREGVVINLAEMRLYYYPPGENRVVTHPIGIGREGWSTPTGRSRIVAKARDPRWVVPESVRAEHAAEGDPLPEVVEPGPDNPLGRYAMRLSLHEYLIHGTNQPWGVGMRVSHGCIRLYPEDIETLFPQVPVGTPVRIVNEPYKAGWSGGFLFVEAHPPLSEQIAQEGNNLTPLVKAIVTAYSGREALKVNWSAARAIAVKQRGVPTRVAVKNIEKAKTPEEAQPSNPQSQLGLVELGQHSPATDNLPPESAPNPEGGGIESRR